MFFSFINYMKYRNVFGILLVLFRDLVYLVIIGDCRCDFEFRLRIYFGILVNC